jgi:hypothetical protein
LKTINKILFQANSLKLFKEVNISSITSVFVSRAVTVLARVDKNNTAVLNAVFLFIKGLFAREYNKYQLSPGFFDNVNLKGL